MEQYGWEIIRMMSRGGPGNTRGTRRLDRIGWGGQHDIDRLAGTPLPRDRSSAAEPSDECSDAALQSGHRAGTWPLDPMQTRMVDGKPGGMGSSVCGCNAATQSGGAARPAVAVGRGGADGVIIPLATRPAASMQDYRHGASSPCAPLDRRPIPGQCCAPGCPARLLPASVPDQSRPLPSLVPG